MASCDVSPLSSPCGDSDQICNICSSKYDQPRVLSCLHTFCELCLEQLLNEERKPFQNSLLLKCPDCGQETKLSNKGIKGLSLDFVTCNQLDMLAIENMQIVCTSCKAKEKAVARCSDCATFLCNNCVTAHQYMRCFENHVVVSFDDMKKCEDGLTIHKPIMCSIHQEETLKYYCHTCEVPICSECVALDHKQPQHHYERGSDVEQKHKDDLQNLVLENRSKVDICEEATSNLTNSLSELQLQRDNAKSHVEETFQSYKAILEKQRDNLLKELEEIHASQELLVMETFHNVEKAVDKIENACKFTERLLKFGSAMELLSLKQVVGSQLLYLINNTPKPEINVDIKFTTDIEKFEVAVRETFGSLNHSEPSTKSDDSPTSQHPSPIHSSSSFESESFTLSNVLSSDSALPSLDVDLANNVVARYNLAQLAGMAEGNASEGSPSPSHLNLDIFNPTTGVDITAAQMNALNNLTALAKLGSVSLNNGNILNGHGALSLDTTGQHHTPVTSPSPNQALRSIQTPPIDGLGSLLNGNGNLASQRVGSPLESPLLNGGNSVLGRGISNSSLLSTTTASGQHGCTPPPRSATVKLNTMQIRCKFGQLGAGRSQFSSPHGFCLGVEEEIIVADTNNHRIQVFDKSGEFRYQFGIPGKEEGQLWYPRKVAVIRSSGKFVVCDRGSERSRMQIFTKMGHFLKKIAIRYIDIVAGLAITAEGNIVAVDSVSPTVFVISESGDLLRWFDCSEHMREPSDIAINDKEYYVCDFKGHCVIVFTEDGQFLRRIGCENITNFPNGIDISDAGDILIGDSHGNRFHVVVFSRAGSLLSEFECPYVKVSRCCGLKITSEGYIVTLAKNNHHVLILNTLYIA